MYIIHSFNTSLLRACSWVPDPGGKHHKAQAQSDSKSVFPGGKSFPFESYFNLYLNYFKELKFI